MSFVLKGIMSHPKSERVYEDDLKFLNAVKDLKKEHGNNLFANEFSQKGSRQAVLKTMNALRVVSPVVCALINHPGVDGKPQEISAAFKKIFTDISFISEKMCEKLDVNPKEEANYWIKNVFEKNFAEIIKSQWETNKSANVDEIVLLLDDVLKVADKMTETQNYDDISPVNNVRVAVMRSTIPILMESINGYHLYRNVPDDLEHISDILFSACAKACEELADPYSDSSSRSKLFYLLMSQATQVYLAAWRAEGMILENMIMRQPERADELREKCFSQGGLPIQKVDNHFYKHFERLVIITGKLTNSGTRK